MNTMVNKVSASARKKLTHIAVGIPPRGLNFKFKDHVHKYSFFGQNKLASAMFVVFSGIFPEGERFFVDSVKHYRHLELDELLHAQVSGFIGQESVHGREHEKLNGFLEARGFDLTTPTRKIKIALDELRQLPPSQQLACTLLMEHFTAVLAEQWLTHEEFHKTSEPEMLNLWFWHAVEELEHKSVAYDVYEYIGNSRAERIKAVYYVVKHIVPVIFSSWYAIMRKENGLLEWKENKRGFKALFGENGFISQIIPRMPVFLTTSFHPHQHDTLALESTWRQKLFGTEGILNEEYENKQKHEKILSA